MNINQKNNKMVEIDSNKKDLELLTLRNVVDALMRYDVKHCPFPQNNVRKNNDMALIDDEKKIIYLDEEETQRNMRIGIIHEFLHAKYYALGIKDIEKKIEKEADLVYERLYGTIE